MTYGHTPPQRTVHMHYVFSCRLLYPLHMVYYSAVTSLLGTVVRARCIIYAHIYIAFGTPMRRLSLLTLLLTLAKSKLKLM
jgi:hypothetical protein